MTATHKLNAVFGYSSCLTPPPPAEGFRWDDLRKIFCECQRMTEVPNAVKYAENYNRLSRVHERYRQTTDTQMGDSI